MSKSKIVIAILLLSWLAAGVVIYIHKDRVQLVKLPPESLAKWYKPQNKRHVWLHNMFKLRRDMQAISHYTLLEQAEPLALWVSRLDEHYQIIREMTPEWSGRLDQDIIDNLLTAQQENRYDQVDGLLKNLQQNCNDCHTQFRTITAMLYRTPDFTEMQVNSSEPLRESMSALNEEVNNIKIAIGAGNQQWATTSLNKLIIGMDLIGTLCENCHSHSPKTYPDATLQAALAKLQTALISGDTKQQGKALGGIAVAGCAQCHGTHRIAYDTKQLIKMKPGLFELLHH